MSTATDVAIIGGGIVGCAAAAFLAEAGAKVELYERDEVGAAASGRNSGSIQHPFDSVLAELHLETLEHYGGLDGLELADAPARVLMLAPERAPLEPAVDEMPLWGVVADVEMEDPPRHVLEEAGVEEVAATVRPGRPRRSSASSRPTARSPWGRPSFRTRRSRRRGRAGCDGAASASCRGWRARSSMGARACPRPQSLDGRPLVGELPGLEGLSAAAGHAPWGISTGPATARIAAARAAGPRRGPPALSVARF